MHNTIGDVALTNISRQTKYFRDLVQYPKQKFFAFPQPRADVLGMFFKFRHFSVSRSCNWKVLALGTLYPLTANLFRVLGDVREGLTICFVLELYNVKIYKNAPAVFFHVQTICCTDMFWKGSDYMLLVAILCRRSRFLLRAWLCTQYLVLLTVRFWLPAVEQQQKQQHYSHWSKLLKIPGLRARFHKFIYNKMEKREIRNTVTLTVYIPSRIIQNDF